MAPHSCGTRHHHPVRIASALFAEHHTYPWSSVMHHRAVHQRYCLEAYLNQHHSGWTCFVWQLQAIQLRCYLVVARYCLTSYQFSRDVGNSMDLCRHFCLADSSSSHHWEDGFSSSSKPQFAAVTGLSYGIQDAVTSAYLSKVILWIDSIAFDCWYWLL